MTDATLVRTLLSTQPDARMPTGQDLLTRFITRRAVTGLMAELGAGLMWTLPGTGLHTGTAGLSTKPGALTVNTAILTFIFTRRASSAGSPAFVRADEKALTPMGTVTVIATRVTLTAFTTTNVTAFQQLLAWRRTGRLCLLCFVKTIIHLVVATLQLKLNLHFAFCGTWFATHSITWMSTLQCFETGLLTDKGGWILVARNHLLVLTLGYGLLHEHFAFVTGFIAQ